MGTIETNAAIGTLLTQLIDRVNDHETALLVQQIQRYLQELETERRREATGLESQLREEKAQLVAELRALLPQAAKERDEARAKVRELEAKIQTLEKTVGAQKREPNPVKLRTITPSDDPFAR